MPGPGWDRTYRPKRPIKPHYISICTVQHIYYQALPKFLRGYHNQWKCNSVGKPNSMLKIIVICLFKNIYYLQTNILIHIKFKMSLFFAQLFIKFNITGCMKGPFCSHITPHGPCILFWDPFQNVISMSASF